MMIPKFTKINIFIPSLVVAIVLSVPTLVFGATVNGTPEASWLNEILWSFVVTVFGTLVWLAGKLLNVAVETYTIGFANEFINLGLGFAVNQLWEMVRDIFNLTFIFGLVYIGFKMILNTGDTNAKRMLVHIILAALLVNFSLFFTKFIIDFTNVAAAQIAQGFYVEAPKDGENKYQVSDKFVQVMGITSIWSDDLPSAQNLADGKANGFTYIFFTMILFIITAFVFLAGAILLMIRFVVLNLYMILSPIMFLGWVFPALSSYSERYWSGFLGRAFFAPAYLLMLYFAFYVMQQYAAIINNGSETSFRSLFTGQGETGGAFATTIPFFAMMSIFLIAAVVVGQKMSNDAAGFINNMAVSKSKTLTGRMAFGMPAWALQKTAGAGANRLANKMSTSTRFTGSKLGRGSIALARGAADSSFDARRPFGMGKNLGIGEGKAGGYTTMLKEQEKKDKAFAESLERKTRDADGELIESIKKDIKATVDKDEKVINMTKQNETQEKDIKAMESSLSKLTDETSRALIQNEIKSQTTELNKRKIDLDTQKEKIGKEAEVKIKYENVLAFRENRRQDGELLSSNTAKIGGGIATAGATAGTLTAIGATGGAILIPAAAMAIIGHQLVKASGETNQKSAQALTGIYGKAGYAKEKKNTEKRKLSLLAEAQKEAGVVGAPTAETPKA